jgi:hypothetical protein
MKTKFFGLVLTLTLLVTASQAIGILPSSGASPSISGVDTVAASDGSPPESGFGETAKEGTQAQLDRGACLGVTGQGVD